MQIENNIKKKAVSGAIWKFLERMSAQLVSMIVAIILARLLEPEDYSVVSIVTIFFTFANVFITSGFNVALIQKKEPDAEEYSSALYLSVGMAVLLYAVLFFCAPIIAGLYERPMLIRVVRTMGLILPVNALKAIVCAYISSNLQFRKFFFATLVGTLASAVIGIVMAYAGAGPWALVTQQMTNTIIDTLILCATTRMPLVAYISGKKIREMFRYSWKVFTSSVIDVIYQEVNPLFIGLKYTGTDLAFYSKGKSFPCLLATVCNSTLSAVLFPVLAKFQDDRDELLRCLRRFTQIATFVVFPALLGFLAVSDNFVMLLLTEKWLPAAKYIRIFCVGSLMVSVEAGNRETLKALGRSDIFLKYEVIKKVFYFSIIGLCIFLTDSPVGVAYSAIGCTAVILIAALVSNARVLGYSIRCQLEDFLPNLACSCVMCIGVQMVDIGSNSVGAELALQILVGIIVYIGVCALTRNESFRYIWNIVKQMIRRTIN